MPESAPVAFQAVVKLRQASNLFMFCELRGWVDLIYNEISLLFRFDLGTKFKINRGSKKCIFTMANLQIISK